MTNEMIRVMSFEPFLSYKEVKSKVDGTRDNTNHGIRNTFVTVAIKNTAKLRTAVDWNQTSSSKCH